MITYRQHTCLRFVATVLVATSLLSLSCARAQQTDASADPPAVKPVTDEYESARNRMVDALVRQGYLKTKPVIKAMRDTRRHEFVPERVVKYAYEDHPLPIGNEQTISAPSIVALMTELIKPTKDKVILEICTGSGYQAAVLSPLCKHLYTIEIVEPLGKQAEKTLKRLGYKNVSVRIGDGYKGWPEHAPFDGIMVTCAPHKVPQPLKDQLKEGGRLVIPVGRERRQYLYMYTKKDGKLEEHPVLAVLFVPMTGEIQGQE